MMVIETDRLIIREYKDEDIDDLYSLLSNSTTMSFWPVPFSIEQTEKWLNRNIESYRKFGFGRWAVILKDKNEFIGDCGIMITEIDGEQRLDLGYIIDHRYWNKGFATEAAKACMEYGFRKFNLDKLYANMAFNHIASQAVAEKIGMKKEKEFYNKRNRNILTFIYSINNPFN